LDQRALDPDDHARAVREPGIFSRCRRFCGFGVLSVPEVVLSLDADHIARHAARFPQAIDRDDGVARALLDDRRDGAGADDLLRQFVGLHGSARAAGRLFLRGFCVDDDARLRMGKCQSASRTATPAEAVHCRWPSDFDRARYALAKAEGGLIVILEWTSVARPF